MKQFGWKTVSVLLPVHNGERWLKAKIKSLLELDYPRDLVEILVISDGSTDATESIASEYVADGVRLFSLPRGGKARALNRGIQEASGEILLFTDVRQWLDPACLKNLVASLADPSVGAVSGELFIRHGKNLEEENVGLYWRYEKWLRKHLSAIDSIFGATGAVYAMRREFVEPLPPGTLLDDVHLPLRAFFRGRRLILDDTAKAFDDPIGLESEFLRKVRTQAGIYQLLHQFPQLVSPTNRMWLHFISYKLARLMLPFALLLIFLSSFFLPQPWPAITVGVQALFYALAAVDLMVSERSSLKRITSPVRTFVVLMAAALCAIVVWFVPPEKLWKPTRS
jgi:cellulose synthase/poly-beta-1,6-N-acetylglucosamine synthase-like glycosyltransferase